MTTANKVESTETQHQLNHMIKKLGLEDDKENINDNQNQNICSFSPIKLNDIKPCKLKTKNGLIEIDEAGNFQMEIINSNILFSISNEGT
jgi:polo-like kinase 4